VRAGLVHCLGCAEKVTVTRTRGGYRADRDCDAVDALRFRSMLDQAHGITDPGPRARLLRSAIALRRGPLLDDVATDAIRQRVAAPWDESWLAAREDAIDAEMACGANRELVPARPGWSRIFWTTQPIALPMTYQHVHLAPGAALPE
jgi:hypothetical protein